MFGTVPLSNIRNLSLYTQQWYAIQVCWQLASLRAVNKTVWHIPLLCVQWEIPDNGQRNCPKHVEFYSKNTFEKLVHLVGFIVRIFSTLNYVHNQAVTQLLGTHTHTQELQTVSRSSPLSTSTNTFKIYAKLISKKQFRELNYLRVNRLWLRIFIDTKITQCG